MKRQHYQFAKNLIFALNIFFVMFVLGNTQNIHAQDEDNLIEGMFDVGGLELYMRCEGTGSPTIVYLHGAIYEDSYSGASSARYIQSQMKDTNRFCIYDRRNVGLSDQVDGYWTGATAITDLHTLLDVADIEPPYILLGASFGGLLSHMYASTYPDEVLGMIYLDSNVPNEIELDELVDEEDRFAYGDEIGTNEELDHYSTFHEALALEAPDIPLIYMHATPSGWIWDDPEWQAAILPTIRAYVDTLDPGIWVEVESPHFMEQAVPEEIIQQLYNLMNIIKQPPCPNTHGGTCRGDLASGTYITVSFQPMLMYSVPEGWVNLEDLAGNILLQRSVDYVETEISTGRFLGVYRSVAAPDACEEQRDLSVSQSVDDLVEWFLTNPQLNVTEPVAVKIGGLDGVYIDVAMAPNATGCSWELEDVYGPFAPLMIGGGVSSLYHVSLGADWQERLYLLSYGDDENIVIEVGPEGGSLEEYLEIVEPILDTFQFDSELIDEESITSDSDELPFADKDAWIVYQTFRNGTEGIWLMRADGTEDHEIAQDFEGYFQIPDWSRDGQRIVMTPRDTGGTEPLYEYDLETETLRQVFACEDPCLGDDDPVYSPDGTQIAFMRAFAPFVNDVPSDCGLMIGDIATGEVRQITSNTEPPCNREYSPQWSPDGTKFTYWRWLEEGSTYQIAVFVMNADGSDERQLTDYDMTAGEPDWSPDGEWIVFSTYPLLAFERGAWNSNLYRMRPDGSDMEQLTFNKSPSLRATQPLYTPDGEWIIFTAVTPTSRSMWVMPADGGEPIVIAEGGIYTHGNLQP